MKPQALNGYRLTGALAAFALALAPAAAFAGTATSSVAVSATVSQICTISTSQALSFGAYDPVSANASTDLSGTATLSVSCTKKASGVTIGLDNGAHVSGSQRRMVGGTNGDFLLYNLFQDSGHSQAWDNSSNKFSLASPSSKSAQSVSIFGVIPQNQDVSVDSYSDTVTATINY